MENQPTNENELSEEQLAQAAAEAKAAEEKALAEEQAAAQAAAEAKAAEEKAKAEAEAAAQAEAEAKAAEEKAKADAEAAAQAAAEAKAAEEKAKADAEAAAQAEAEAKAAEEKAKADAEAAEKAEAEAKAAEEKAKADAEAAAKAEAEAKAAEEKAKSEAEAAAQAKAKAEAAAQAKAKAEAEAKAAEEKAKAEAEAAAAKAAANAIPKLVFIVPYRDREHQKHSFDNIMPTILEDIPSTDYKIYFIQQCDTRDFNRGAMKNIGFLAMKNKYPNDYQNITFVFNDVDTMPRLKNLIDYNTELGKIKHFYGQLNTLGGIVSIKGADFEKTLGYPNFWAWGYEDNMIQIRAIRAGLTIDRTTFFATGNPNIIQLNENNNRIVNRDEFNRYINYTNEGFASITDLVYDIDESTKFVNVTQFKTDVDNNPSRNEMYDLRRGNRPFNINPLQSRGRRRVSSMGLLL